MKQKCLSKKPPKNVVQWVSHALDGNGFFHISHAPIKPGSDNRTAKITLDGGSLSTEQLIAELQARIPCQSSWNWNVRMEGIDFIATLPSADDLQRVIQYGGLFIKEKKIHLNFEVWSEE